jgi:hypothetical protein
MEEQLARGHDATIAALACRIGAAAFGAMTHA